MRTGVREARSQDVQRVAANQELESMEGSAPSKVEEKPSSISIRRARKVGAPATWDSVFPLLEKKNRNMRKTFG
jgi:hypothetical protein